MSDEVPLNVALTREVIALFGPLRELAQKISKLETPADYDISEIPEGCIDLGRRMQGIIESNTRYEAILKKQIDMASKAAESAALASIRDELQAVFRAELEAFRTQVGDRLGSAKPAAVPDDAIDRFARRIGESIAETIQAKSEAMEARLEGRQQAMEARLEERQNDLLDKLGRATYKALNQIALNQQETTKRILDNQEAMEQRLTALIDPTRNPAAPKSVAGSPDIAPSHQGSITPLRNEPHMEDEPLAGGAFNEGGYEAPLDMHSIPSAMLEPPSSGAPTLVEPLGVSGQSFVPPARKANMKRWSQGLNSRNSDEAFLYKLPSTFEEIPSDGPFTNPKDAQKSLSNCGPGIIRTNITAKPRKCVRCQTVGKASCE